MPPLTIMASKTTLQSKSVVASNSTDVTVVSNTIVHHELYGLWRYMADLTLTRALTQKPSCTHREPYCRQFKTTLRTLRLRLCQRRRQQFQKEKWKKKRSGKGGGAGGEKKKKEQTRSGWAQQKWGGRGKEGGTEWEREPKKNETNRARARTHARTHTRTHTHTHTQSNRFSVQAFAASAAGVSHHSLSQWTLPAASVTRHYGPVQLGWQSKKRPSAASVKSGLSHSAGSLCTDECMTAFKLGRMLQVSSSISAWYWSALQVWGPTAWERRPHGRRVPV